MDSIVSIDLETTGLDPQKDTIIEIGAVKFNNQRIEQEWATLINPGKPIPPFISQLTGITDQMVASEPFINKVIPSLEEFIGATPVLGHNIRFDLAFLQKQNILKNNKHLDTYELSAVLLPTAARYNLSSLSQLLGVLLPATHRALEDAHATRGLYLKLIEECMKLPISLLAEIVRISEHLNWGGYWTFKQILNKRSHEIISPRELSISNIGPVFREALSPFDKPLHPKDYPIPLDNEEITAILGIGGAFSKHFPNYEHRSQQVAMLSAVTDALSHGRHLMVEAGTGTGKGLAYLIPAAIWAINNDYRIVISTNTINLQDQLINKDIPGLIAALGIELRTVVVKGRANYLCPRRLENFRRRGPENDDEMRVLAKVLVWLQTTITGDLAELNLNGPYEREIWMKICAEDDACTTDNCINRMGGICPYYRTHLAAQNAHLIIINHSLLLADVATGNKVLPPYDYLIVDEAHHLEEATTNSLSFRVTQNDINRLIREIGGPNSATLGRLVSSFQSNLSPTDFAGLNQIVQRTTDLAFHIENVIKHFFTSIDQYLYEIREGKPIGQYALQERIIPASRAQPAWSDVELAWDEVEQILLPLKQQIEKLMKAVAESFEKLFEEDEEIFSNLSNIYRRLDELYKNIHALVFQPNPSEIYWIEMKNEGRGISLHAAPLHIGPLMEKYLWHEKNSVILTSATLTTAGEFNYLKGRLSGYDADELALGSPFDYENSTLVYLVNDIPEPSDRYAYQRAVESGIVHICRATGGRALVLFTSYDQLKRTSKAISSILAKDDILVYEQGEGASPHSLLESFRLAEKAVLLGTRAFWEGVDVPGEALSILIIAKLPFDVPTDPIVSARAETFDDPFYEYSLPEAILRFRQGFGRLIRTKNDRGVVITLDKRILTKKYGRTFVDSLPACTVKSGALSNAPKITTQWLNL
jgi:ATP-dependent DNA helicase DinG